MVQAARPAWFRPYATRELERGDTAYAVESVHVPQGSRADGSDEPDASHVMDAAASV